MLRWMESILEAERAFEFDPVLGCRIYTLYDCYQNQYPFLGVWTGLEQGEVTACISILGGIATVAASPACNWEELAYFLGNDPTIEMIETMPEVGKQLLSHLPSSYRTRPVLKHCGTLPPASQGLPKILTYTAVTHLVFSVLKYGDPEFGDSDFGSWFYDIHRRIKNKHCELYAAEGEDGNYLATAGYYVSSPISAVVGGVATLPEYRRQGYATALVRFVTARILSMEKDCYLIAANEALVAFYERIGYQTVGEEWLIATTHGENREEA